MIKKRKSILNFPVCNRLSHFDMVFIRHGRFVTFKVPFGIDTKKTRRSIQDMLNRQDDNVYEFKVNNG